MSYEDMLGELVEALDEGAVEFTEWEEGFIWDMKETLETMGGFTPGQEIKIEEIWEQRI